jgi:hypothetical protein
MADQHNAEIVFKFPTVKEMNAELVAAKDNLLRLLVAGEDTTQALEQLANVQKQMAGFNDIVKQNAAAMQNVKQAATKVQTTMQGTTTASANAGMALLNLNYVIRDSPYFFNNFALGLLAVGNNLNPLIDSFAKLKKEALEKNLTTVGLLRQALVGGAGLSIAFSVVVTAIQSFVFATSKAKSETSTLEGAIKSLWSETYKASKTWDEFVLSLEKMSKVDLIESLRAIKEELKEISEISFWEGGLLFLGAKDPATMINEYRELLKERKAIEDALAVKKDKQGVIGGGIIEEQEALVESYQILEKSAKTDSERLGWLKLYKEAQEKLNELMGKGLEDRKEKEKEITGEIHKQAEAMRVLMNVASGAEFLEGDIRNLRGRGVQPEKKKTVASLFEGAYGQKMEESMGEFNTALETGKIFAQQLGDTLNQAFMQGKASLDEFIKSLISAIAQMAILKAITSLFTGGFDGGGAVAMGASPSVGIFKRSPQVVVMGGDIKMNSREFLVQLKTAETTMQANR